jgi:hypothetical protein
MPALSSEQNGDAPRKRVRGPKPTLRVARFEDYDQLIRLEAHLNPETLPFEEWRALWLDNPLWPEVASRWPIGWVLEIPSGELVGCVGNVPVRYHFRGERLIGATGRAWFVLPQNRAYGASSKLMAEYCHQPVDLVLATSVSAEAVSTSYYFARRIPAGDWEAVAYFVTGHRPFASRALRKLKVPMPDALAPFAGAGLHLKDAFFNKRFPKANSAFTIEAADRFDSSFNEFWNELLRQKSEVLLSARDSATLAWHFALPIRRGRLWILTARRNGQLRAYTVFERKDDGTEPRRMRLVDYQTIEPEAELLADLLALALRRCSREGVCVLDMSGLGLPKMRMFEELAPYRRKQNWPFWYRTMNSGLADVLARPESWEPTEYDGDASLS